MKYILLFSLVTLSFSLQHSKEEPSYENAEEIYDFFIAKNWTLNAICGMLGNIHWESDGIQPDINEMGGSGYGLVQWTPGEKLKNWTDENGLDYRTIDTQCRRIQWELENNEQYYKKKCNYANFKAFSKSEDSPEELAYCFMTEYERPNERYAHLEDRQQYAKYWYYYFTKDHTPLIFTYQIKTENGTFSELVEKDNKSYAGVLGEAIADVAIKANIGIVNYRVHAIGKKWYGIIRKFDWSDSYNGYAGIGHRIDKIKIYFDGAEQPYYRVASIGGDYSKWQYGIKEDEKRGFKGYAGEDNVTIEKLEIKACIPRNESIYYSLNDDEFKCIYPDDGKSDEHGGDGNGGSNYSKNLYFNSLWLLLLIINLI